MIKKSKNKSNVYKLKNNLPNYYLPNYYPDSIINNFINGAVHECGKINLPRDQTNKLPLESPLIKSPFSANAMQLTNLGLSCFYSIYIYIYK